MDTRTVGQHASLSDVAQDVASQRDNGIAPYLAANYALAQIAKGGDVAGALRRARAESAHGGAPTLTEHGSAYLRAVARMVEQGPGKCDGEG